MAYTPDSLNQNQYDVLADNLDDNSLLPKSSIAFKNKGLNTTKQSMIQAVNEVLATLNSLEKTIKTTVQQQNSILGNFLENPQLVTDLQKIDVSVLESVIKINKEIVGDPDHPVDISDIGDNIKSAIKNMNEKVKTLPTDITDRFVMEEAAVTTFVLSNKAIEETIVLLINGISYDRHCFIYDQEKNSVTWTLIKENQGFDITCGDEVMIKYQSNR